MPSSLFGSSFFGVDDAAVRGVVYFTAPVIMINNAALGPSVMAAEQQQLAAIGGYTQQRPGTGRKVMLVELDFAFVCGAIADELDMAHADDNFTGRRQACGQFS